MNILTAKQKRFADEYMVDFNATQAAIRAGYSKDTAAVIASQNLKKQEIKDYLKDKLDDLVLPKEEALKLLSDIARASLNDYFVIKEVEHRPRVVRPLKTVIQDLEEKLAVEKQVSKTVRFDRITKKAHTKMIRLLEAKIIRNQLTLKQNPKATAIVDGDPVMVETAELDMARLIADKERGRVKSVSFNAHGPKVEMYSADVALSNLCKIHGLYKDEDKSKDVNITINGKGVKITEGILKPGRQTHHA